MKRKYSSLRRQNCKQRKTYRLTMLGRGAIIFNGSYKNMVRLLLFVTGIQIFILFYLVSSAKLYDHIRKQKVLEEGVLAILDGSEGNGTALVGPNGRLAINMSPAMRNSPFKETYSNAKLAFAKQKVPPSLLNWRPSEDSCKYWQPIGNHDAWVYSMYFDHQKAASGRPLIRGFGLARIPLPPKVYFHFYGQNKRLVTKLGRMIGLPAEHHTIVNPVAYECRIGQKFYPKVVSISFEEKYLLTNKFDIQYPGPRTRNFTVCYSALHSVYNFSTELIHSVELNRVLGAEHFFVYNFSVSPQVDMILRHYQAEGIMTVLQWPLPTIESWYLAQIVAINDCIYRNRNVSQFVVLLDTDEFIIPNKRYTWMELLQDLFRDPNLSRVEPDNNFEGSLTINPTIRKLLSVVDGENGGKYTPTNEQNSDGRSDGDQNTESVATNGGETSFRSTQDKQSKSSDIPVSKHSKAMSNFSTQSNITIARDVSANSSRLKLENSTLVLPPWKLPKQDNISHAFPMPVLKVWWVKDDAKPGKIQQPIGSFVFRCVFFDKTVREHWNWVKGNFSITPEEEFFINQFSVQPLQAFARTNYIFPSRLRSKNIVRPEMVYTMGIHFAHIHMMKGRRAYVNSNVGLLHHYRVFDPHRSRIADTSAFKYKAALLKRLRNKYSIFSKIIV